MVYLGCKNKIIVYGGDCFVLKGVINLKIQTPIKLIIFKKDYLLAVDCNGKMNIIKLASKELIQLFYNF